MSEFDYIGWEEFGEWKRATTGQIPKPGSRHCEEECNFPSSCHWNEQHAAYNTEPDVKRNLVIQKGTESYIGKAGKEAERQNSILPTIEEDGQKSWNFDATPKLNGLGLHNPGLDFASSEEGVEEGVDKPQIKLTMPKNQQHLAQSDDVGEDEVEMRDWIGEDDSVSGSISPCALTEEGMEEPFDFRFEQDDGAVAFLADEVSPLSPIFTNATTTWRWTADEIGLALSPPGLPREGEM